MNLNGNNVEREKHFREGIRPEENRKKKPRQSVGRRVGVSKGGGMNKNLVEEGKNPTVKRWRFLSIVVWKLVFKTMLKGGAPLILVASNM